MKVSVLLTTYNHEKWIAQAVDSVLMQKTNFDYEIVIMEDCSTDSTRDIVLDFQRKYPDKIRLILSEKNKNDSSNFITAWQTSPSQYVAILDGDDYWTSSHKLQRQVDFLDTHPEYTICFHNVTILYEDGSHEPWDHACGKPKETSTLEDLWAGNFIPGPSPMLRKGLFGEFLNWFDTDRWTDWPLYILNAQHGNIGYIDKLMGVYRVHSEGLWSGRSETEQLEEVIKFYKDINADLDFRYKETIDVWVSRCYGELAREKAKELEEYLSERNAKDRAWNALQEALQSRPYPTAPIEFVDVSSWEPDPEQGRWLAWQLQILNKEWHDREQQLRRNHNKQLQKLRKQNRRLAQQLQDIKDSRTWKLLKRVGHLRVKTLGR